MGAMSATVSDAAISEGPIFPGGVGLSQAGSDVPAQNVLHSLAEYLRHLQADRQPAVKWRKNL